LYNNINLITFSKASQQILQIKYIKRNRIRVRFRNYSGYKDPLSVSLRIQKLLRIDRLRESAGPVRSPHITGENI